MGKGLVIVESPSKAKTIKKYLGDGFEVTASVGHIKDLPKNKIGVDLEKGFEPEYVTINGKAKVLKEIRALAKKADVVYLAPDPDREGEAIAWHLAEEIRDQNKNVPIFRILINEITKKGVNDALSNPQAVNRERFESQQARRILDRLVGYSISPVLWDKVKRGLSAGRVQSVAVRLIVDREREIQAFTPEEYWSVEAHLEGAEKPDFWARLVKSKGRKAHVTSQAQAEAVVADLQQHTPQVSGITRKERKRNPPPAFTTSKLQQAAAQRLRFTAKRTMSVAQRLYEGIELGEEGAVGLITYMRTDSTRLSKEAVDACRVYIKGTYGDDYVPAKARVYKTKKGAQDAHEAIRPTSMEYPPERIKEHLSREQFQLYRLIWQRFLACQMESACYDQTTIDIESGDHQLRATGSILTFPGYLKAYDDKDPEDTASEDEDGEGRSLPEVKEGEALTCHAIKPEQHFTQPPARFSEATLVKELEEQGIGRPSTYAAIISTIQDKGYVAKNEQTRFAPTELGSVVTDLLVANFPNILDTSFTASMEEQLDQIEEGEREWTGVLRAFYDPFSQTLEQAREEMRNLKREAEETDIPCEKCGAHMVIKWGKNGYFLACSAYPECKSTAEFERDADGTIHIKREEPEVAGTCEKCSRDMIIKTGRYGRFLACSGYPECKNTQPFTIAATCPKCSSPIAEKRSKRNKIFYGCTGYPDCKFAVWDEPVNRPCPACDAPYLLKKGAGGTGWACNECKATFSDEELALEASPAE